MVKLRNSVWNIRRSSRFIRCWLLIHAWRTARSPVSTFLPHFVRRFTPTNMQCDYFATRHVCARFSSWSSTRVRSDITAAWYLWSRCAHMCAVVCARPRASATSRLESTTSLPRPHQCRSNRLEDKLGRSNVYFGLTLYAKIASNTLRPIIDVVFYTPRPCFSGFEETICSGRRSSKEHKFNVSCKS